MKTPERHSRRFSVFVLNLEQFSQLTTERFLRKPKRILMYMETYYKNMLLYMDVYFFRRIFCLVNDIVFSLYCFN